MNYSVTTVWFNMYYIACTFKSYVVIFLTGIILACTNLKIFSFLSFMMIALYQNFTSDIFVTVFLSSKSINFNELSNRYKSPVLLGFASAK